MSPRAYIVERTTTSGKRFHVRYKPRGARTPVHWGAYKTRALALRASDYVNGELAIGRYPDRRAIEPPPTRQTVLMAADSWIASHPDPSQAVSAQHRKARTRLAGAPLARIDVQDATFTDVQDWVNRLSGELAPTTVRRYLTLVRGAFVHAGRYPDPSRDSRIKLPLATTDQDLRAPSWAAFCALREAISPRRHRPVLELIERTGLRTKEVGNLTWGDIDLTGRRLLVRAGATKRRSGGRRWVPLVGDWPERIDDMLALEDRSADRPLFEDFNSQSFRAALARAATQVGSTAYSPHDLRHRYISLLFLAGIDPVLVSRVAGHRKQSMSFDVYGHVLLDEPEWRLDELRSGVSWVSGLGPRLGHSEESPANEDDPSAMGSTGIEPVTSRV